MCLREQNYDVTEAECDECEAGMLWVNSYELVCDTCGTVTRTGEKQQITVYDPLQAFYENREQFRYRSGEVKMTGGFSEAYPYAEGDWGDDPATIASPYTE